MTIWIAAVGRHNLARGWIGDANDVLELLWLLLAAVLARVRPRHDLVLENLLLRHQLSVLTRPTRSRRRARHVGRMGNRRPVHYLGIVERDDVYHRIRQSLFDPRDADHLAAKLARTWQEAMPGPDALLEAQARLRMPDRVDAFGRSLFGVVQNAAASPVAGGSR